MQAHGFLLKERFKLPACSTLDRLARYLRYAVNSLRFSRMNERLPDAAKKSLIPCSNPDPGAASI